MTGKPTNADLKLIRFKPAGFRFTDVYRGEIFIGSLRKDGPNWRWHRKGDLTGTELCRSPTAARAAVLEIEQKR